MSMNLSTVKVVDAWKPGNPTGRATDARLYEPRGRNPLGMVIHSTVGRDSLSYLQGGVLADGRVASTDQLIHKNGTIYNMIPPGMMAYHAGVAIWNRVGDVNRNFIGVEIENMNDGNDPYTNEQYLSAAANYAYKSAVYKMNDLYVCGHYECALPLGRKSDPFFWNWSKFWELVWEIRKPENWPAEWGIPRWNGGL